MPSHVTFEQATAFRREYLEGYTLAAIAKKYGVTEATVKRHAAYKIGERRLLPGTEVHIDGQRGRWEFKGELGYTPDGKQYATFTNVRTGRNRVFYTDWIGTVHRKPNN